MGGSFGGGSPVISDSDFFFGFFPKRRAATFAALLLVFLTGFFFILAIRSTNNFVTRIPDCLRALPPLRFSRIALLPSEPQIDP
jgi:hypothetical protein